MNIINLVYEVFRVYGEENVTLFCTDTDPLHFQASGLSEEEFYDKYTELGIPVDIAKVKYARSNTYYRNKYNENELGSVKDEGNGKRIIFGIYKCAKNYREVYSDCSEVNKMKGTQKSLLKNKSKDKYLYPDLETGLTKIREFQATSINKNHKK